MIFTLPFIISYGLIKLLGTIEILARSQKDWNVSLCCAAKLFELAVLALKYYDCVVTCWIFQKRWQSARPPWTHPHLWNQKKKENQESGLGDHRFIIVSLDFSSFFQLFLIGFWRSVFSKQKDADHTNDRDPNMSLTNLN